MLDYLSLTWSHPLEREYEAWLVHGIEDYFLRIGAQAAVFAVSPTDEKTWPADEALTVDCKVIGLQIKRPTVSRPCHPNDFSKLSWNLANPPYQLARVLAHKEIHYVLPTFTNRTIRSQSLHHTLFWRPSHGDDFQVWYKNNGPKVKTSHSDVSSAPRWGLFVESIVRCDTGIVLNIGASLSEYIRSLKKGSRERNVDTDESADSIALMLLPISEGNLTTRSTRRADARG
jgi:hypothetical protein